MTLSLSLSLSLSFSLFLSLQPMYLYLYHLPSCICMHIQKHMHIQWCRKGVAPGAGRSCPTLSSLAPHLTQAWIWVMTSSAWLTALFFVDKTKKLLPAASLTPKIWKVGVVLKLCVHCMHNYIWCPPPTLNVFLRYWHTHIHMYAHHTHKHTGTVIFKHLQVY